MNPCHLSESNKQLFIKGTEFNTSMSCICSNETTIFNASTPEQCLGELEVQAVGFPGPLVILQYCVSPLMLVLGILGNLSACVILLRGQLKRLPCCVYISALAVSDSSFLVAVTISWLKALGINIYALPMCCEFLTLISNAANFLCSWYLVCLAMDRYIVVCCPRFRRKCCTTLRAKMVVTAIAVVAVVVYVNTTIMVGVVNLPDAAHCIPLSSFLKTVRTLEKLDVFFNNFVPFFAILLLICCVCYSLVKKNHGLSFRTHRRNSRRIALSWSKKAELRLTNSVIIYLLSVFVLQVPGHSFRIATMIKEHGQPLYQLPFKDFVLHEIFQSFFYLSFAIKPFILLASWREFRQSFAGSVGWCIAHTAQSVGSCFHRRQLAQTEVVLAERRSSGVRQYPSAEALKEVTLL